jgi:hypothetical protein
MSTSRLATAWNHVTTVVAGQYTLQSPGGGRCTEVSRFPASSCLCREFSALTVIQRAVLGQLIRVGAKLAPFTAVSLAAYSESAGKHVTAAEPQAALEALLAQTIVWVTLVPPTSWMTRIWWNGFWPTKPKVREAARGAMTIRLATEVVILKRYNAPSSFLIWPFHNALETAKECGPRRKTAGRC